MKFSFEALGTRWWIEVFDEISEEKCATIKNSCALFATNFENKYSRFKKDSLISLINQHRTLNQPDKELLELLSYGKNLYLRSNTHFNFLTGHIQEANGYDSTYSFNIKLGPKVISNPITDLIITDNKITLLVGSIDLGGFGKGYLIDKLADFLSTDFSLNYFLINGGGDMYATSQHDNPIEILLEHPTLPGQIIKKTTLYHQGFAASSPYKRIWQTNDGLYSHIITNHEMPEIASYVKAKTACLADAFATTVLLSNEAELGALTKEENLDIITFNPETNQIWQIDSTL